MNKIYKVVWNKARNCYVVVSELTKSQHKSSSKSELISTNVHRVDFGKAAVAAIVAGLLTFGGVAYSPVLAADDTTVTAPKGNAVVFDDKGSLKSTDANIEHKIFEDTKKFPEGEGQSIALGHNAHAHMQEGWKAYFMLFGMKKAAGAIAIGEGAEALSQSIDIGNRTYTGDMGDVTISKYGNGGNGSGVASVLLGTNSYTGGTLSTLIGDYSIMSTAYPNKYDNHSGSYTQNAGAVSIGALNSIESATSNNDTSGVANSIVGLANKTNNANGALIYGAGNTITNSFAKVATPGYANSAAEAAHLFRDSVQKNPGGAALAIGGGNTIDGSIRSQVIGVNNELTGNTYHKDGYWDRDYHPPVDGASSQYNMINGYNNTAQNVNHAYVIGTNNTIQGKNFSDSDKMENGMLNDDGWEKAQKDDNLIVIGDNHTLANDVSNDIILGTADKALTTSVSNAVMIGHNANATVDGGVALGADSVADRAAGNEKGAFAPETVLSTEKFIWTATAGAVSVGSSTGTSKITRQITNVAAGTYDTDAVNVAQLKKALESIDVDAGSGIKVEKIKEGVKTTYKISTNIKGDTTTTDTTTVTPNQTDAGSTDTSHTVTSEETNTGSTDTSQGTTESTSTKTGKTVTVSTTTNPTYFGADDNQKAEVKPSGTLNINGDGKNISTSVNGNSIKVELKKDITVDSVTAGDTSISTDGLTIKDGPSITKDGIDGGNKQVTNVAAGDISEKSTDAVNGSQLFATNQQVAQNAQSINKLGNRVNKVGAGAAALAALHPLDFDPDAKWDFAAGYGNYRGTNAAAVGAYYRPNEDTMFSVGGTFGNGENMVNAGVSFKLGSGSSHVSTSRVAMAKEIKELRGELEAMKSAMLDANAGKKIDTSKLQLFPDVPQNHWAYEYVTQLAGNGMIEGYPDGNFAGDRPMTRYEFAAILYRAMTKGAVLSDKILSEFSHELEYFTVDTVAKDKAGNPTIQRVRTVKANTNK